MLLLYRIIHKKIIKKIYMSTFINHINFWIYKQKQKNLQMLQK